MQRIGDPSNITGVRYSQVSMKSSLIIPDTEEGIEILFSLQPANINESSPLDWLCFRVMSFDITENSWTEHCVGLVHIETKQSARSSGDCLGDINLGLSQLRSIRESTEFVSPLNVERMYSDFESAGMVFGELLRNIQKIDLSGDKKSCRSTVKVPEIPPTTHGRYLLHPSTFESILHILLPICASSSQHSMVATYIEHAWVSSQIDNSPNAMLESFATTERKSATSWHSRVLIETTDTREPRILVHGVELVALPSAPQSNLEEGQFYTVELNPVAKLLRSVEVVSNHPSVPALARTLTADDHRDLQMVSSIFILDAIDSLKTATLPPLPTHHEAYIAWMKQQLHLIETDCVPLIEKSELMAIRASADLKNNLIDRVTKGSAHGEILTRVGSCITPILEQKVDCLELMFGRDDLMMRTYDEDVPSDITSRVATYLKCLSHNMSEIKVLEVGAGTGSATSIILESLVPQLEDDQSYREKPLAGIQYHFTDISAGFFEKAQVRFSRWSDHLQFKTLNIEGDPVEQGFELGWYDLIVASNVSNLGPLPID